MRRQCDQRLVAPGLVEGGPIEVDAEALGADLPRFEAHPAARVLLNQIVGDVEREVWDDMEVAAADRQRQHRSPALIGVKERIGLHRFPAEPSRLFGPREVEGDFDLAGLTPALVRRSRL